jgi:hypothetical protein
MRERNERLPAPSAGVMSSGVGSDIGTRNDVASLTARPIPRA